MKNVYAALLALLVVFAPLSAMADTWGDQINDPTRFVVLASYNNAAVLDNETGLVWEQFPSTDRRQWLNSLFYCSIKNLGNRLGWRLPTVEELSSLVDPSVPGVALPAGHPFSLPQESLFWSATTVALATSQAYSVSFAGGLPGDSHAMNSLKTFNIASWCVRGGQGVNPQ